MSGLFNIHIELLENILLPISAGDIFLVKPNV